MSSYAKYSNSSSYEPYRYTPSGRNVTFPKLDNFYYRRELLETQGPGLYRMDPNRHLPLTDCAQHIPGVNHAHVENQGILRSQVDFESDLRRQFRPLSLCPTHKYQPHAVKTSRGSYQMGRIGSLVNCESCENCNLGLPCGCQHCKANLQAIAGDENPQPGMNPNAVNRKMCKNQVIPEQTRKFGKACNLPGVFINRFEPLCDDLQNLHTIHSNNYIGSDTRNLVKDAYAERNHRNVARRVSLPKAQCS